MLLSEQVTTSKADQSEANPRSRDQSEAWDDIKKAWDLMSCRVQIAEHEFNDLG